MVNVPVHDLGLYGIVKDIPAHELPPGAWSAGGNIRFRDGKVVRSLGHSQVFGTPSIAPYWAMHVQSTTDAMWLYANQTSIYATDGTTHANVSNASGYNMDLDRLWSGGVLGGIPVITNGVEPPQFWATATLATLLANLTNWPAVTLCRDIKPFKNHLVALDITKAGVRYPHMIKWSHPADPGTVPSSWDETDATLDAGEKELDDVGSGFLMEGLALGDSLILYKEGSTWGMQYIGGVLVFRFYPILLTTGILSKHCSTLVQEGRLHFVATGNDVIVHDGRDAKSVLDKRWRKYVQENINSDEFHKSFVVANEANKEAWFCFPTGSSTWPNLALIWNWKDNTIGVRTLPSNISFIAPGVVVSGAAPGTWNPDSDTWDSDTTTWDQRPFGALTLSLLMTDPTNTKMYLAEDTNAFDGSDFDAYVERTGLAVVGQDRDGKPKVDLIVRKLVTRIWPRGVQGTFDVLVGYQETIDGATTWSAAQTFITGTTKYLDFTISGKLIAVKYQDSAVKGYWEVSGQDLEVELLGTL